MRLQSIEKVAERAGEERDYDRSPRWGRRFLIAITLLLIAIIGGFWGWTAHGRGALNRQVAAYIAAGEPIEPGDFIVVGVSDDDNAVIPLREAAGLIDEKTAAWTKYEQSPNEFALPLTDKELNRIRDATGELAGVFAKLDDAMKRKAVNWKTIYRSPAISTLLPDLSPQRNLARLAVNRARLNYQQGDHAAAIADLRRAMFIGNTVGRQPLLICHLVSIGINGMVNDALAEMSSGLKIGNGAGEVRAAELNELIAQLLDDKPARAGFRRGMQGERMIQLDTARCIADGRLSLSTLGSVAAGRGGAGNVVTAAANVATRPIALSDGLLMIDHTTAIMRAHEASADWPTYKKNVPIFPDQVNRTTVRHMLARMMLPDFEHAAKQEFRVMADRRMTAIALAIRLHAVDHGGKLPAKLDELVPRYRPAVPPDPFAATTQPLKYIADAGKPRVYSVGEDGIDGGGSELLPPNYRGNTKNVARWNQLDAVLHLTLQPRELPREEPEQLGADGTPEIYPNEREIRTAATRATTAPATSAAPAP